MYTKILLLIGLLFLFVFYGCGKHEPVARTTVGIGLSGGPISTSMILKLDDAYMYSVDCWNNDVMGIWIQPPDPWKITAYLEPGIMPAYAKWSSIHIDPNEGYSVVYHEMSHVISRFAKGYMVRNYDGRCGL